MLSADFMNMSDIVLRRASVDDGEQIFALKRQVFGSTSLPYTIYQAEQSLNYLRDIIPVDRFTVATSGLDIVGYYHAFRRGTSFFLNYIATSPYHRGHCVGQALLHDCIATAQTAALDSVDLDVFASNSSVVNWYSKNGFVITGETYVQRFSISHPLRAAIEPMVDQSEMDRGLTEEQQRGFSQLPFSYNGSEFVVGVIAGHTCKLLQWRDVVPQELGGAISCLLPSRSFLVITSSRLLALSLPLLSYEHSLRMSKALV
jgi:ribosomal protein S18 acetylase RimI-like enzyme